MVSLTRPAFVVLVLVGAMGPVGCEVDPMAPRTVPKRGMIFTNVPEVGKDLSTSNNSDRAPKGDLGIESVEPSSGSPAGGDTVFVHGWGFVKGVKVYFGPNEATEVFFVNSKKLRTTTPPGTLGLHDVIVRWPAGQVRILPSGYLYASELRIDTVAPAVGPIDGGTPVTVTGSGFLADTKLIFGSRLALEIEVVDEETIFAVAPAGDAAGPVRVHASNVLGTATKKNAFSYTAAPVLEGLAPAAGPIGGGNAIELRGTRLSSVAEVYFGSAAAEIVAVGDASLTVLAPPHAQGATDVVVSGDWGWDYLEGGYLYFDPSLAETGIFAVVPSEGPESGGSHVTLVGCDLVGSGIFSVTFGATEGKVEAEYPDACCVVVNTPPGEGAVDVTAAGTGWSYTAPAGFTYIPMLDIAGVEPKLGPCEGGTLIRIEGSGFTPGAEVRVGPMPASEVKLVSDSILEARTPPGSPGLADVVVISEGSEARLPNGFLFTVKAPEVWVVTPNYGSRAGGTFVEVIGAGFMPDAWVFFDAAAAPRVTVKSYNRIWAYTPPSPTGTVDVVVNSSMGQARLGDSYSYFNPISLHGGTWGEPVDGAVNVTVLDIFEKKPIEGVTAVLGADPETRYKGTTDENGQVTLSGPGLVGPVDLHVSKKNYDAASFIHFDAENATLYLTPHNPPSTGPSDSSEPVKPGVVKGRVVGLGKYVLVPLGDCRNKQPGEDGICSPCVSDDDCGDGFECLVMGKAGKFCTRPCQADPASDCPEDYSCMPYPLSGLRCLPAAGKKEVRCEVTTTSIYQTPFTNNPSFSIGPDGKYELESRPGEVAVVCVGGWEDLDTGQFHPLAMGVKRHVNVNPGATVEDQNIWLNLPLNRRLRLRMDSPPEFGEAGGIYRVSAYLDFGSDGIYKLPSSFEGPEPTDVVLESLPDELSGDLYDAEFLIYAGAYTNNIEQNPYSVVFYSGLKEFDESAAAVLEGGEFVPFPGAPAEVALTGAATVGDTTWVVGERGQMFKVHGGTWFRLPRLVDADLLAVHAFMDGHLVAVGDGGVVLSNDSSGWSLVGQVTDQPLRAVWGQKHDDFTAVGAHRIVSYYAGTWTESKVSHDLFDVTGTGPDDLWAVGLHGAMLRNDGISWFEVALPTDRDLLAVSAVNDVVICAGRGVALWRVEGEWLDMGLDEDFVVTSIRWTNPSQVYFVGSGSKVAVWTEGAGFSYISGPDNLVINDVFFPAPGEVHAIGSVALLLGPFIPFQRFTSPMRGKKLEKLFLAWWYQGNTDPISLHTIGITERTGRSLWRLVVDGQCTEVALPDFWSLAQFSPMTSAEKRLRIYSAYAPEFSMENFNYSRLGTLSWKSWSYDMIKFDL